MTLEKEEPIPVYILTGFLGSGKTTLLRRLLSSPEFSGSAVIINEFGSTSVDHLLLDHSQDLVEPIAGGCLCCLPRSRLVTSMFDFLQASYTDPARQFSKLIIETSGLSDPLPLIQSFGSDPIRLSRFRLAKVITVVDATGFKETDLENSINFNQISSSDAIVVSKADLVDSFSVIKEIIQQYSDSPIFNSRDLDISIISDSKYRPIFFASDSIDSSYNHIGDYFATSAPIEKPLAKENFSTLIYLLRDTLGVDLLRLKGLVPLKEYENQAEIHVSASGVVSLSPRMDTPRSPGEVVAIVRKNRKSEALRILGKFNSD